MNVAYLCNMKRCGKKCSYPECKYTLDYKYALNKDITPDLSEMFVQDGNFLFEKEDREPRDPEVDDGK